MTFNGLISESANQSNIAYVRLILFEDIFSGNQDFEGHGQL